MTFIIYNLGILVDKMDLVSSIKVGNDHRATHVGNNIHTRDISIQNITISNEADHSLIQALNGGSPVDLLLGVFRKIADLDGRNLTQDPSLLRDVLDKNKSMTVIIYVGDVHQRTNI